ncbi:MAG: alpha/beta hydrolase [Sphingomonadaceae bacterium]|nr:alpha/beta hydrolase [Sphingomonadaceae bacterium]
MAEQQAWRAVHYRSADDRLDLFARDYPGGEGASPLLMMHGLTRNSADFEPLVQHLGDKYRMIVPDQRGRARSEYDPDPANYRPDIYVPDMWALLDTLGIERVTLVGTSMGGLMSMIMGATRPDRISAIVLNDIGPELMQEGLDRIRTYVGGRAIMKDWDEAADRCKAINETAMDGFTAADWLAFARRTCEQVPEGGIRFAYDPAIAAGMAEEDPATVPADLWPMWDTLSDIPVLALRGAKSDLLSAETVQQMKARHSGPFAHADIAGRGHAPILDEPDALAAIEPFLAAYG